ncbi:unnamed protein product [Phaedon cochleariae]|uniref:Ig-like domain-containing protein n=1 Tax=Phaedon cochleariae TaxID=80249 RepID=A0A9P0GSS7_PHACE|nr:unnamed protein product [Phaedon cochleariae]
MQILWQMYPLLLLQVINDSTGCSVSCACRWKNGKQTVECENKGLIEIPDGLDPETQVLDFPGNKLSKLSKDLFLKKKLINLQRVYLPNCKIKSVHRDTFKGLTNLVELDLSGNLLESVPTTSFPGCPSLMKLTLSMNPITAVKESAFESLTQLNNLELSYCKISDIEEGAFHGLHSLEWLHLDNNRLKTIPGRRTLPDYVKGVDLEKNIWECDCHISDLAAWLREFGSLLSVEPVCYGPPRLASRAIKSIPEMGLACLPNISPTSFYLELGEGKNVSLSCHVQAVPEATVSWWFQGEVLHNDTMIAPGVHLIYYIEEGNENKRSELFIYNADADDNGTYICNADNAAGTSQSNFTIRIILKENPIVIIVSVPFEYFLYAIVGFGILGVFVLIAAVIMIMKCRRRNRRMKKLNQTEEIMMQYEQNGSKLGEGVKSLSNSLKDAGGKGTAKTIGIRKRAAGSTRKRSNFLQPASGRARKCWKAAEGTQYTEHCYLIHVVCAAISCIIDPECYPVDYGLPKLPCRTQLGCEGYYRTLPSNRMKRHSAANPVRRASREADFLTRTRNPPSQGPSLPLEDCPEAMAPSFSPYCPSQWPACVPANVHVMNPNLGVHPDPNLRIDPGRGVRFDPNLGVHPEPNLGIDPGRGVRFDPSLGVHLDPNLGVHPDPNIGRGVRFDPNARFSQQQCLPKRSASAQTDECEECDVSGVKQGVIVNASESPNTDDDVNEGLTESPDEGYGGEPSVV